jgi:hypothetical protein
MGSGLVLNKDYQKYGVEQFTKTIIEYFDTSSQMYAREKEVVTAEFIARPDTYNLRRGGTGGFDYINQHATTEDKARAGRISAGKGAKVCKENKTGIFSGKYNGFKSAEQQARAIAGACSPEANAKRKETYKRTGHCQGAKNPSFGTCWIFHELIGPKKIKRDLLPEFLEQGWLKGKQAVSNRR